MQDFRYFPSPLRLFGGPRCLEQLPAELARLGSERAVLVCGVSLARDSAALARVRSAMGARCAGLFDQVQAHSPLPGVQQAAQALAALRADAVVAVGGGSAIVTARAASILLAEQRDIAALCTARNAAGELVSPRLNAPKLPQIVVPTTPTTAMVKAGSAVLDPVHGGRLALFDPRTRAQAVFLDPQLLAMAPARLVASAGLNTLSMAVEGLMSGRANPLADAPLLQACRLAVAHLPAAVLRADPAARLLLAQAAVLAGQGTDQTGVGIGIPLGHALSARLHLDGGLVNGILLPHVIRFNEEASAAGLAQAATALGAPPAQGPHAADLAQEAVQRLLLALGLPVRLRELGVARAALAEVAGIAIEDWFVRDNPRPIRDATVLCEVLEAAW